jgi:RHS repeat-associated protein
VNNITEKYKYTGKEKDITGLYYYGARYYDPTIGRFITRDPVKGNIMNPQTLNPYVYCLNNPLKYIDPDGRESIKWIQETYGFDSSATADDIMLLCFIVGGAAIGGGPLWGFFGGIIAKGIARAKNYFTDSEIDALNKWLKEHEDEIEDWYLKSNEYYVKSNGHWKKITFNKDFWGDWDAEAVEVPKNELPEKLKNDEKESSPDNDPVGSFPGGNHKRDIVPI